MFGRHTVGTRELHNLLIRPARRLQVVVVLVRHNDFVQAREAFIRALVLLGNSQTLFVCFYGLSVQPTTVEGVAQTGETISNRFVVARAFS